jgi:hypothetical protein
MVTKIFGELKLSVGSRCLIAYRLDILAEEAYVSICYVERVVTMAGANKNRELPPTLTEIRTRCVG